MACTIRGSFHQGDTLFSDESRGQQCTANATVAIVVASYKEPSNWTPDTLNNILIEGDSLYKSIVLGDPSMGYLSTDDIPDIIDLNGDLYDICMLWPNTVEGYVITLPEGVAKFFETYDAGILTYVGLSIAIGKLQDDIFWCFDSHSRDGTGLRVEDGASCLSIFRDVSDMCHIIVSNSGDSMKDSLYKIQEVRVRKL
jgi:hypothetical protein